MKNKYNSKPNRFHDYEHFASTCGTRCRLTKLINDRTCHHHILFFYDSSSNEKAKQEKEFKESVQKGDKVVTIGGLHGKIVEVNDKTFMIEVDNNVKLKIEKSAISAEATKQYQTDKVATTTK